MLLLERSDLIRTPWRFLADLMSRHPKNIASEDQQSSPPNVTAVEHHVAIMEPAQTVLQDADESPFRSAEPAPSNTDVMADLIPPWSQSPARADRSGRLSVSRLCRRRHVRSPLRPRKAADTLSSCLAPSGHMRRACCLMMVVNKGVFGCADCAPSSTTACRHFPVRGPALVNTGPLEDAGK